MQLPRERLLTNQARQLSEVELLAAILRAGCRVGGSKKNVLSLAAELLWNFKGLSNLMSAAPVALLEIGGIGPAHAAAILAAGEIGRRLRVSASPPPERVRVEDPRSALALFGDLAHEPQEVLMVCFLTARHDLIETREIFRGTIRATTASPREILQIALRNNAAAILVAHNHPSGDTAPSDEDVQFTEQLGRASWLLGIDLVDHLIVGPAGSYHSMRHNQELSATTGPRSSEDRARLKPVPDISGSTLPTR